MKILRKIGIGYYNKNLYLLLSSIIFGAIGQVLMKAGAIQVEVKHLLNLAQIIFSPMVLVGLGAYALSSAIWLIVLTRIPLSVAYPFGAISYVLVIAVSAISGEQISSARLIGVIAILTGILLIGTSKSNSKT